MVANTLATQTKSTIMKKVILIANDAEACGKTTLSTVLCGLFQRKQISHKLVTTSPDQDIPLPTFLMDLEDSFNADALVDLIDHHDAVIIDCHTGGANRLARAFEKRRMDDILEELEAELTVIIPVCQDSAVLESAHELAEGFARMAEFLVVHAPLAADIPESWSTCPARRILQRLGATEVSMPGLADGLINELDNLELDLPLALSQRQHLPRFVRHELLSWEVNFCENLRAADGLLLASATLVNRVLREDSVFGKTLSI
jgi:hypothetical protein